MRVLGSLLCVVLVVSLGWTALVPAAADEVTLEQTVGSCCKTTVSGTCNTRAGKDECTSEYEDCDGEGKGICTSNTYCVFDPDCYSFDGGTCSVDGFN